MSPPLWMDSQKAPLNPCSLETIPEPVKLADGSDVWPLMLSCYQLEDDGSRSGQMDLHLVNVPDIAGSNLPSLPLQFGKPRPILSKDSSSGILDGKWSALPDTMLDGSDKSWCFATAHSSGEIRVQSFEVSPSTDFPRLESEPLYKMRFLGQSDAPEADDGVAPLCLSLNWNSGAAYKHDSAHLSDQARIVSTYSHGRVAVHDVAFLSDSVQLVERDSWTAHNMFKTPTEVWSACFMGQELVLSCGDEGNLKFWDTRSTTRPVQILKQFDAGVTCVSPHPVQEHLVACGSYDETVCLYDVRYVNEKKPLIHTKELGGGIWRIKWHPYIHNRIVVAAMHGGCRVVQFAGLNQASDAQTPTLYQAPKSEVKVKVTKSFTEHTSMAYGVDWLVCRHPTQDGFFEAAGSCSFYDRAMFLWDTVF